MTGSGREASRLVGMPTQMSGSVWETLTGDWEALPDEWEWSGGPPGCPGVVGRPSRMSGSGREALPDDPKWSGDPPECPGVVGRLFRMSRGGGEALLNDREKFAGPHRW